MDFKVRCVRYIQDKPQQFTVGKIYDVVDNILINDFGIDYISWSFPRNGNGDFEALRKWFRHNYEFELVEDKKVFTKKDLKSGDVIKKRDGSISIVVLPLGTLVCKDSWNSLDDINDDLTSKIDKMFDIVGVRRPNIQGQCGFYAFDCDYGELVYDRERDVKSLYNGKVVCLDNSVNSNYTVGKIYQFKDGQITADNGKRFPMDNIIPSKNTVKIYTFEDWKNWSTAKWLEIKE